MTVPRRVALVGCGYTGTSAFFQLVQRHPVAEISIFEATGEFGPGYPYRLEECQDYLLNNTTDSLGLIPQDRRAFLRWLQDRGQGSCDPKGHVPRSLFGAYLKDAFAATLAMARAKSIAVRLIPEEAKTLRETEDGTVVIGSAGSSVTADVALLTTGRSPDKDLFPQPPLGSSARYFPGHVLCDALETLPRDATVHVLGASLSAYDVINRLFSPRTGCRFIRIGGRLTFRAGDNARHVVLCSRSGRLKNVQSRYPRKIQRLALSRDRMLQCAQAGGVSFAEIMRAVRADAGLNGAVPDWSGALSPYEGCESGAAINERAAALLDKAILRATDPAEANFLVDLFAEAQTDLWDAYALRPLSLSDEMAYRADIETALLSYAAPCPAETAEKILALQAAGRLSMIVGVRDVTYHDEEQAYRIAHRFGLEKAQFLVNVTGRVDRDVTSARQSALIRNLVESGLLRGDSREGVPMPGAAVDMGCFRARGAKNVYLANMLLWGPGFYTSSAFMMSSIVEKLLAHLYGTTAAQHNSALWQIA